MEVALSADGAEPGETMIVLRGSDGVLYLDEAEFARLRLHVPQTAPENHDGHRYYAPSALKGCTVAIDEAHQRAVISAPASALDTTHLNAAARQHPSVTPAAPGGFLNYQLSAQQIDGQTTGGVLGEMGVFAGAGVLTNSDGGTIRGCAAAAHPPGYDLHARISGPAGNSECRRCDQRSRRMGQCATLRRGTLEPRFHIAAGFGDHAFVDGRRHGDGPLIGGCVRQQPAGDEQPSPGGAFVIDRLPTITGSGDVNVVVRDALGREQVITQSFYTSTSLLAQGLSHTPSMSAASATTMRWRAMTMAPPSRKAPIAEASPTISLSRGMLNIRRITRTPRG